MNDSTTKTAILTAILTGVFTVLAAIATYWLTNKVPELTYTVAGGPSLAATAGSKRIFVVEVKNSGGKEIAQTYLQLTLPSGEFSEVASEASPGVKITEEKSQKQIEIRADLLNTGDSIKVSFLTLASSLGSEPRVTVRAPGVTATEQSNTSKNLLSKEDPKSLILVVATTLAAILSSFLLLLPKLGLAAKLGIKGLRKGIEPHELCAYVCAVSGLHKEADNIRFSGNEISFRGTADYLKHRAQIDSLENRYKYVGALRLLLLTKCQKESMKIISNYISEMTGKDFDVNSLEKLEKTALFEGDNPSEWRKTIDINAPRQS